MLSTVGGFLLTLGVLILVHEWGHYRVARACGVKVLRFSMGFGRVIWRRQASPQDTEFVLSWLPLGGYVRMLDEREAPVPPALLDQTYNRKPLWQRSAIVAAGPLANLVLAVLLYAASHWVGVQEPLPVLASPVAGSLAERAGLRAGDAVQAWRTSGGDADAWQPVPSLTDLRWQLTQAAMEGRSLDLRINATLPGAAHGTRELTLRLDDLRGEEVDAALLRRIGLVGAYSEPVLGEVKADGPAALAGARQGDRVLRVDDRPVADAVALRELIRQSVDGPRGRTQRWEVERGGRTLTLEVTPRVLEDGDRRIGRVEAYIGEPPRMVLVRADALDGLAQGLQRTWEVSQLSLKMLWRMLTGEASVKNLSGPLTIADYAGQSVQQGLGYYLGFLAMVSVSLGVLNLLPLPMLDGGHLMYHAFEAVTGRPVSDLWLARLQRGGLAVLLLMMSVALYNDVARLLGLH
ncbi:MAG: metalloprotease RseP [Pseudomonadota bacterium]|jgi:regulator of sigma E protease